MNLSTIIVIVGILGGCAGAGYYAGATKYKLVHQKYLNQAQEAQRRQDKRSYDAGADHKKDQQNETIVFVEVEKIVEKIVRRDFYRDMCFDDAGVQVINAATRGLEPGPGTVEGVSGTD